MSVVGLERDACSHASQSEASTSGAIERDDFAGERPFLRVADKSSTHRILPHIIPLLRIAFIVSQDMIEEAALPDRVGGSDV